MFFLFQPSFMLIKNLHYVWRNQVLGFTSHVFLELYNNFRKPYIHSSLFIIGLYTEVLHYFGGTADRCRVSIYPYRWQGPRRSRIRPGIDSHVYPVISLEQVVGGQSIYLDLYIYLSRYLAVLRTAG